MSHPLAVLLAQLAIILALSRLMGMLFSRFKQPQVIGEIIAGLMLGPTLLGNVWPQAYESLFPPASLDVLGMIAQIGVILFLFLIGLEFDPKIIQKRGKTAAVISVSGIVAPFVVGFSASYLFRHLFTPERQADFLPSALFMGAAMSVTAFPVLARIVSERNLQKTEVGGMAVAAAAVDDVLAWTMLAVVLAFIPNSGHVANPLLTLGWTVVYVATMVLLVRPFLRRLEKLHSAQGTLSLGVMAVLLLTVLLSAIATEFIGIHALFGAFVAGFVMPKGEKFVHEVTDKLETFAIVFLLPTFFAYAGLKADLSEVVRWNMIGYTALIIVLACAGKLGGCMLSAKACGMTTRDSFTLGVLMNTRGLMELIILTVGLSLGVINQNIYGMMVIMALVTTGMAAPMLEFLLPSREKATRVLDKVFSILIPVSRPESGGPLVEMASYIAGLPAKQRRIYALYLSRPSERNLYRKFTADVVHPGDVKELEPLLAEATERLIAVKPMSFYSRDVPSDIARVVRQQDIDLVLMGYHMPVFGRALLGGTVHRVLTGADSDVAVFVDRSFREPTKILVPFMGSIHDKLALTLAGRIARTTGADITLVHVTQGGATSGRANDAAADATREFTEPTEKTKVTVKIVIDHSPAEAVLAEAPNHDLMIIGVSEEWGLSSSLLGLRAERIASESKISMLIVRRFTAPSIEARATSEEPALAEA